MQDYPIQFGKYLLLERIAVGGMAEIFRSMFRSIEGVEKVVAVKRILPEYSLDEEFVALFIDEARLSATLQHPNIVQVFDFGKLDRNYYLAMEFVDGPNLKHFVRKLWQHEQAFPIEFSIYIIIQLLKALDYLYRATDAANRPLLVIHRDISPQNILLSREGEVKITDFGIAKAASKLSKTVPGKIQGKFGYMSPEQAMGKELDHRSDLFSLGVIFFEMLTGKRLYGGENTFVRYENVKEAKVQPVSKFREIPDALDRIITKMLQKDPDDRYQNSSELQKDLTDFLYPANTETVITGLSTSINKYFPKQQSNDRDMLQADDERRRWWQRKNSRVEKGEITGSHEVARRDQEGGTVTSPHEEPHENEEWRAQKTAPTTRRMGKSSKTGGTAGHPPEQPTLIAPPEGGSGDRDKTPTNQRPNVIELYAKVGHHSGWRVKIRRFLDNLRPSIAWVLGLTLLVILALVGMRIGSGLEGGNFSLNPFAIGKLREDLTTVNEAKHALETKTQELQLELDQMKQSFRDTAMDPQGGMGGGDRLRTLEDQFAQEQERWGIERKTLLAQIDGMKSQLAAATQQCPDDMVHVTPGKFMLGSPEEDPERNLGENKEVLEKVKGFCIDPLEYPNIRGRLPKVLVSWSEALNACENNGKRLCSEKEWERACKGTKGSRYTYGNDWVANTCVTEAADGLDRKLAEAGSSAKCTNDFGVFDMSGNALEWIDTAGQAKANNPSLKGGSFDRPGSWSRCAARLESNAEAKNAAQGFRCCKDVR